MISPHTKPGTKVVYLEHASGPLPNLKIGGIYTVDRMEICDDGEAGVLLVETLCSHAAYLRHPGVLGLFRKRHQWAYDPSIFEYAALPSCLTELLETSPVRAPSELEPTQ